MPVSLEALMLLTVRSAFAIRTVILGGHTSPSQSVACSGYLIIASCPCNPCCPVEQHAGTQCETWPCQTVLRGWVAPSFQISKGKNITLKQKASFEWVNPGSVACLRECEISDGYES